MEYEQQASRLRAGKRSESGRGDRPAAKRVAVVSLRLVRERSVLYANRRIGSAEDAYQLVKEFLDDCDREVFVTVCLSVKNEPLNVCVSSVGSLDATIVHPRETYKTAVLCGASSILVAHCHPSGDTEASSQDVQVTDRLVKAGQLLGIDLLDHLIVGDGSYVSLREAGHIKPPRAQGDFT